MPAPSRMQSLATLRNANIDVAFATAFGTLVGGSFMVGFIQHLGGGDLWIGWVTGLPALAGLFQIPGAAFGRSKASYKSFVQVGGGLWRLLHFPLVLLALVTWHADFRLSLVLLCIGLAGVATQFVGPSYNEWIGNIVPERSRGWYFSQRTLMSSAVGMVVGLMGAWLLDRFKGTPFEAQGFAIMFGLAATMAAVSWVYFQKMGDLRRDHTEKFSFGSVINVIREPFADKNFRKVIVFIGVFWLGGGFAGNLFSAYALESLEMPFFVLQLTSVTHTLGTILTVKMWGWLSDKYGNKPILMLMLIGVTFTPIMWTSTSPLLPMWQNATILIGGHIFAGIFWSGIGVTTMNLYLATSSSESRGNYLASVLTVQALVTFLAPLGGAALMAGLRVPLGAVAAYKAVFVVTVIGRGLGALALIPVKEQGSTPFGVAVRNLAKVRPGGVAAMRAMRSVADDRDRESAIRRVGEAQFTLATEDLTSALSDPSPRVRREASMALGRMGTVEAGRALIKFVEEQPEHVEEETLEALANTPHGRIASVLMGFLDDPSPILRRAAAKALGKVGDPISAEALGYAARQPGDPDLRRASIQALRVMGERDAHNYHDALFDNHPSVRTAAAEAVAELEILELAEPLRQSLDWLKDEGASETAYALGVVGRPEDVGVIVETARSAIGKAKVRRCLLGVARLMGVEDESYRMLTMDEVARENLLLQKASSSMRRDAVLREAIEAYSVGDEVGAVELLCARPELNVLLPLARHAIPEGFLVTVLAYLRKIAIEP